MLIDVIFPNRSAQAKSVETFKERPRESVWVICVCGLLLVFFIFCWARRLFVSLSLLFLEECLPLEVTFGSSLLGGKPGMTEVLHF